MPRNSVDQSLRCRRSSCYTPEQDDHPNNPSQLLTIGGFVRTHPSLRNRSLYATSQDLTRPVGRTNPTESVYITAWGCVIG